MFICSITNRKRKVSKQADVQLQPTEESGKATVKKEADVIAGKLINDEEDEEVGDVRTTFFIYDFLYLIIHRK